jgi:hypothetical protein
MKSIKDLKAKLEEEKRYKREKEKLMRESGLPELKLERRVEKKRTLEQERKLEQERTLEKGK